METNYLLQRFLEEYQGLAILTHQLERRNSSDSGPHAPHRAPGLRGI
ncbi:hypothetical protein AB0758_43820 [Tolypothrix bouteillei VB521301_2]